MIKFILSVSNFSLHFNFLCQTSFIHHPYVTTSTLLKIIHNHRKTRVTRATSEIDKKTHFLVNTYNWLDTIFKHKIINIHNDIDYKDVREECAW